jgi:hypothetical protein
LGCAGVVDEERSSFVAPAGAGAQLGVYPPPHAVRGRGTARKRGGGGMLSRGFSSDESKRHRRGPLPARGACHRAGHFGPDPLARHLPRCAGEDDSSGGG